MASNSIGDLQDTIVNNMPSVKALGEKIVIMREDYVLPGRWCRLSEAIVFDVCTVFANGQRY